MSDDKPTLQFTGERFTPECVREIAYEHWHRYAWALSFVKDCKVLDVACGEGYGSHLLASVARFVHGVDVDAQTVGHAKSRYHRPNLEFTQADVVQLPFDTAAFDRIVCFETIEHLHDHEGLLAELNRVLKPGGLLILSSPNKESYSYDVSHQNPFHCKELYQDQLVDLLKRHFKHQRLWGQKLVFASSIGVLEAMPKTSPHEPWLIQAGENIQPKGPSAFMPQYFLAIASQSPIDEQWFAPISLFADANESVYQHYHAEIQHHMTVGTKLAEKDQEIERLRAQINQPWWRKWWSFFQS